ncbi:MAG: hypothetical protein NUV63_09000, partial [Gallionella sp.]|nr:hypothetical protein [Gallionella sp.]
QILPVLQVNSCSIDQKSGEIWTAQADLQPISFKGASINSSHRRRPVSSLLKILDSGLRRNDEI